MVLRTDANRDSLDLPLLLLDEDSKRRSVVDYIISPTLASQVLALTWQRDMWLHVTYGV